MSSQSRHLGRAAIAGVSCSAALATTLLWPGTATADTSRLITRFYESEGAATALFDPTGQRLYVPTLNAVDVFNIPASRLAYSIKISDVPHDATLSRNGKRLYFTSEIADTVSAIDLVKRRTISTTHVCKVPTALVVSPTGTRVYTACGNGAALAVIDPKIHTMTGKILTGLRPESVAITADGSRVFIANEESNSISVVDTRKSQEIDTIPTGTGPTAVATTPDGSRIYVTCSGGVWVIDVASRAPVAKVPIPRAVDLTLSTDGSRLYVAAHGVAVIDTSKNTLIGTITLQDRDSYDIDASHDGRTVAAVVNHFVYLVDVAGYAG